MKEYKILYTILHGVPKEPSKNSAGGSGGICYEQNCCVVIAEKTARGAIKKVIDTNTSLIRINDITTL